MFVRVGSTTRFALACNQSDKIIEAIQSRCVVLRYSRLTDIQVLDRVVKICELEGVARSDDGLEVTLSVSRTPNPNF